MLLISPRALTYASLHCLIVTVITVSCPHCQSYIWNLAASERIRRYGLTCVGGDLVGVGDTMAILQQQADEVELMDMEVEGGGHDVVDFSRPSSTPNQGSDKGADKGSDAAATANAVHMTAPGGDKKPALKIHVLTEEDITAGTYTITDVLLPLPGTSAILTHYYHHLFHNRFNPPLTTPIATITTTIITLSLPLISTLTNTLTSSHTYLCNYCLPANNHPDQYLSLLLSTHTTKSNPH